MTPYEYLRIAHISFVLISISLFVFRFALLTRFPDRPLAKLLKVVPHINDTLLLTAAFGLLMMLELNPLTASWLVAKIAALVLYVVLGAICMRAEPRSRRQQVFFALALGSFSYIVLVALTKQAVPI
jgi:uncharacterized membrane protein SirB2